MPKIILLILFLLIFSAVDSQKKMDKSRAVTGLLAEKLDSTKAIDRGIIQAIEKLKNITGLGVNVFKTNYGPVFCHPSYGIVLNIKEFNSLIKKFDKDVSINDIITLIICHELAHMRQFKVYGIDTSSSIDVEERKLYETQADILAGFYFVQLYSIYDYNLEFQNQIRQSLEKLFFFQGEFTEVRLDYPDTDQRIWSVMFGMDAGIIKSSSVSVDPKIQSLINTLKKQAQYNNEEITDWSLTCAKNITGFSTQESLSISLESEKVLPIKDYSNHYEYDLTYKNIGNHTISVNLSVVSIYKNTYQILDRVKHSFTIAPGQSYLVKGELETEANGGTTIVYPPISNCLASFTSSEIVKNYSPKEVLTFSYSSWKASLTPSGLFAFFIDDLLNLIRYNNYSLMYGPCRPFQGSYLYKSSFKYPHSKENNFLVKGSNLIFKSLLYSGSDYSKAHSIFSDNPVDLKDALNLLQIHYSVDSKEFANEEDDYNVTTFELKELRLNIEFRLHVRHVKKQIRRGNTIYNTYGEDQDDVVISISHQ